MPVTTTLGADAVADAESYYYYDGKPVHELRSRPLRRPLEPAAASLLWLGGNPGVVRKHLLRYLGLQGVRVWPGLGRHPLPAHISGKYSLVS